MHWSTFIVLSAGLAAPQATLTPLQFNSYTKAYHAAVDIHKPMLVIINPAAAENATAVTLEQLQADATIGPVLDSYVVAIVDASSEHGQEVHRRFESPALPFAAVIDERQDKQVYRSAAPVSVSNLQTVVPQYKDGVPVTNVTLRLQPPNDCPNCRRQWMNF